MSLVTTKRGASTEGQSSPTTELHAVHDQAAQPARSPDSTTTQASAEFPEPATDQALIDRVRAGDNTAEQMLYRMYVETALSRAQRLGAQPADAEDYVAEAFLRVLRRMRQGGGPDFSFAPYLFAVARNLATDAHRGQRACEWPTDQIGMTIDISAPRSGPDDEVEARISVRTAMALLPQRWRDILWRVHVEGQSPSALAKEFGVTANSVSVLAHRARKALRCAYAMSA
jgi:RNA polymerase sigma factor (sigma-70 family)